MSRSLYMRSLGEAPQKLDEIARWAEAERSGVAADKHLTVEGQRAEYERIAAEASSRVQNVLVKVKEDRQGVQHWMAEAAKAGAPDGTEAVLEEAKQVRAWDRARRQLDADVTADTLIAEAAANGDVATLRALRTELPSYFTAKASSVRKPGQPAPPPFTSRPGAVDQLVEKIDRAEAPHLPHRQREAMEAKLELPKLDALIEARSSLVDASVRGSLGARQRLVAAYAAAPLAGADSE